MTYKERVERLKEQLADIEHQRWADWQKWCHEVLRRELPLDFHPRLGKVLERWDKQIATPYKDLSEKEKQSDRDQVDRYFPLILHLIEEAEREASLKTLEEVSNKAVELHITDLEMKQHHTGVGWEDVIMADEITKMRLAELKGE